MSALWVGFKGLPIIAKILSVFVVIALLALPILGGNAIIKLLVKMHDNKVIATERHTYETKLKVLQAQKTKEVVKIVKEVRTVYLAAKAHTERTVAVNSAAIKLVPAGPIKTVVNPTTGATIQVAQLSKGWVAVHDASAGNSPVFTDAAKDPAASNFTPVDALKAVVPNYGLCYMWKSEDEAWRSWYVKVAAAYNSTAKVKITDLPSPMEK